MEWPTIVGLAVCYVAWGLGTTWLAQIWMPLAVVVATVSAAFHSSLSHEALHGHPTRSALLNAGLVFPALSVTVPYLRFKDTHLAHHNDEILTDPYDDPESNYLDPIRWARLPRWKKRLLRVNNTLAGRLILGPAIGTISFLRADLKNIRAGDRRTVYGWMLHIPAVGLVFWWMLSIGAMPIWVWACSVYFAMSLLKIRTFLEHRADRHAAGRTVIVEDRGPLSWIFLNNNFHVVHHMHPALPWYRLPREYKQNKDHYLTRNRGYTFASYWQVFNLFLFKSKDPVPHPLWSKVCSKTNRL
ncbi:MAG: fatty acid desaturase [Pelagimonas sp.]|uniref:fatty acid desaturase n=1 Tax=Pelagimonas sp. TaxID=2073170 RepID=UPI003D6C52BD